MSFDLSKYQAKKEILYDTKLHKESVTVECHNCSFKGQIDLYSKKGGVVSKEREDRTNIFGVCPKCDKTIISFHI